MKERKALAERVLPMLRATLRILVFPVLIRQILVGKVGYVYLCVLTLMLMELPGWVEDRLGLRIPALMEGLILLFLFSSEILGEIRGCYVRFSCWDVLLHGFSGFLFASIGWILPELLGQQGRVNTVVQVLFALCFSVTIGVVWEFLEWGVDSFFGLDMQKDTVVTALRSVCLDPRGGNGVGVIGQIRETVVLLADGSRRVLGLNGYLDVGLQDTMGDLLVDLAGALVFAALSRWERIAHYFVPVVKGER